MVDRNAEVVMDQTAQQYFIFETAGGFCGIAWNDVGITRFQSSTSISVCAIKSAGVMVTAGRDLSDFIV